MTKRPATLEERFWAKVDIRGPDECWPWKANKNHKGYGRFSLSRKNASATWIALELDGRNRPSPAHEACHACDNPPCVNPAHLWWGTRSENVRDSADKWRHHQRLKTKCCHGHPLSGDNLRVLPNGRRECRACRADIWRRQYERRMMEKRRAA